MIALIALAEYNSSTYNFSSQPRNSYSDDTQGGYEDLAGQKHQICLL